LAIGGNFEAGKWSVRLSYLLARDIARLVLATQDGMVAHSGAKAKDFFAKLARRKPLACALSRQSSPAPNF
jgi:hypothetical protein